MQSNTIANEIVHFVRHAVSTLAEVERGATGGAGSGVFKPVIGHASGPTAFEGVGNAILAARNRLLLATNGGDKMVRRMLRGDQRRAQRGGCPQERRQSGVPLAAMVVSVNIEIVLAAC